MSEWITTLHEFFIDRKPFIVATIVAYHGSSPDTTGVALLHSDAKSRRFNSSDQRHKKILKTAAQLLAHPVAWHTEQLQLGKVAGTDNSYCEVVYEYFDANNYPQWLTELRTHSHNGVCCTLLREFDNNLDDQVIRTEVLHITEIEELTLTKAGNSVDYSSTKNGNSTLLLRNIRADNIAITLIGNHPVADEIRKQCSSLPIEITRIDTATDHSHKNDIVIIMTTDHELDYQYCEAALKQLTDQGSFIGCIGSEKKADIFKTRLLKNDIKESQLKNFYMPVGVRQISGKQNSVVAASIVAQILMLHRW